MIDLDKIVLVAIHDGRITFHSSVNTDADNPYQIIDYGRNVTPLEDFCQTVEEEGFWRAMEEAVQNVKQFLDDGFGYDDVLHLLWYYDLAKIRPEDLLTKTLNGFYIIEVED